MLRAIGTHGSDGAMGVYNANVSATPTVIGYNNKHHTPESDPLSSRQTITYLPTTQGEKLHCTCTRALSMGYQPRQ